MPYPVVVLLCLLVVGLVPAARAAEPPTFRVPLTCTRGQDCWLLNLVDVDPGPAGRDYACGDRTYDRHKGTDFAIADAAAVAAGVPVRAPAAGRVVGLRDGMEDIWWTPAVDVDGRECGNGVRIDHGDGWISQLCHLRRGSLLVAKGDTVEAGQPLGMVGLSGKSAYPHVHIGITRDGKVIDPFTGRAADVAPEACGDTAGSLWRPEDLAEWDYRPSVLKAVGSFHSAGFDSSVIEKGYGTPTVLPASIPVLGAWAQVWGVQPGDSLHLAVTGPDGAVVVDKTVTLDRTQAQRFAWVGRRRPGDAWPAGTYMVTATYNPADGPEQRLEQAVAIR